MPKDRRTNSLSSDRSRSSPYPCSSNKIEEYKQPTSLGLDEDVRCPDGVEHSNDNAEDSKCISGSAEDIKEWEEIRCPICMEHPHNAVLLHCSSYDAGCRPYLCDTSYRHSNCLDQFRKSAPSPSADMIQDMLSWSTASPRSQAQWASRGHSTTSLRTQPKLSCPLCRGEISGWSVVKPAREFMNSKVRSCSCDTCDFSGNYSELRKHARSNHPLVQPSAVDPQRAREWTSLQEEREFRDVFASIGAIEEEDDWDDMWSMPSIHRSSMFRISILEMLPLLAFDFLFPGILEDNVRHDRDRMSSTPSNHFRTNSWGGRQSGPDNDSRRTHYRRSNRDSRHHELVRETYDRLSNDSSQNNNLRRNNAVDRNQYSRDNVLMRSHFPNNDYRHNNDLRRDNVLMRRGRHIPNNDSGHYNDFRRGSFTDRISSGHNRDSRDHTRASEAQRSRNYDSGRNNDSWSNSVERAPRSWGRTPRE